MKIVLTILIALVSTAFSQEPKNKKISDEIKFDNISAEDINELEKVIEREKKVTSYFLQFLKKEYVEESEKKLPKLEKELNVLERKLAIAQNKNLKKKIQEKITEKKAEIEIQKMWKIYYQAYIIREQSYGKDDKKYMSAFAILIKIENRYKQITAKEFIHPEFIFKQKYAKQIEKMK